MNQVLIIYLIILLGYFAARQQVITSDVRRGLVGIVMNFAMPAMIVASLLSVLTVPLLVTLLF